MGSINRGYEQGRFVGIAGGGVARMRRSQNHLAGKHSVLQQLGIGTNDPEKAMHILSEQTGGALLVERIQTTANPAAVILRKARGDLDAKVVIADDDNLGDLIIEGYVGANNGYQVLGDFRFEVDGSVTDAAFGAPVRMVMKLSSGSGLVERLRLDSAGNMGIGMNDPATKLTVEGAVTLKEQGSADADTAAYGQMWVKTATPNELYFTTDGGHDIQLTTGTGLAGVSLSGTTNNTVATVTGSNALVGEANLTFNGNSLAITTGSSSAIPCTITGASGQSVDLLVVEANGGADYVSVNSIGSVVMGLAGTRSITTKEETGTNTAGKDLLLKAGKGTGSGVGGDLGFYTAPAGSPGGSTNDWVEAMAITTDGSVVMGLAGTRSLSTRSETGTNTAGKDLLLKAGKGTGSAAGGELGFYTAPAGSPGSGTNAWVEAMAITTDGSVVMGLAGTRSLSTEEETGTNTAGKDLLLKAGKGTGSGAGGDLGFYVAPAGGSGSSTNAWVEAMAITTDGSVVMGLAGTRSLTTEEETGTNTAGRDLLLKAGKGTGSGAGGDLGFYVAPAGGSGSGTNAWVEAMAIAPDLSTTMKGALTVDGSSSMKEQSAADADVGAYGQVWVKTATPNQLYFTTDAGDDIQITDGTALAGGSGSGDITAVTIQTDSGSGSKASDTSGSADFTLLGGSGMDVTNSGVTITVDGEDATTSNKGVASFHSDNFSVSSGAVTIKDQGVLYAEIQNVSATNRILGRDTGGAGVIEELDKAAVLTMLNVADGATAGGEANEDSFKNIAVSGQDSVVAESAADTLTFAQAGGITLTTNATSDTVTISSADTTYSPGTLLDVSGTTFNVDLSEAAEAVMANGDYILFLDGGATGTHAKEAIADVATLFAGDGLTASSSVLAVNVDDSTIETNSDAIRVKDDGVTYAKIQNVSADERILGRVSGADGVIEELTKAQVLTMLNVADGATAGGEANESSFKTISVSGQDNVVADADDDTLTFAQAGGITLTTNATSDTVTISSADTNTTYSPGDGLDLSGTTFSTDLKSNGGLVIESTELAVDLGASSVTGTLAVGDGGSGQTSYTNGQLLVGNTTGNTLAKATLTAGSGISITNGTGSVTIAASGGGGASLSGSTNNTVATVTGSNALIGEANLTFDGNSLSITTGSASAIPCTITAAGSQSVDLLVVEDSNNDDLFKITNDGDLEFGFDGTGIIRRGNATGTNVAGGGVHLRGGKSTGNALGGEVRFYTSPAGSSGSGVNNHAEAVVIDGNKVVEFKIAEEDDATGNDYSYAAKVLKIKVNGTEYFLKLHEETGGGGGGGGP